MVKEILSTGHLTLGGMPWSSVASKDDHPKTTLAINPRLYVKHQCKQNKNIFNTYCLINTDDVVLSVLFY